MTHRVVHIDRGLFPISLSWVIAIKALRQRPLSFVRCLMRIFRNSSESTVIDLWASLIDLDGVSLKPRETVLAACQQFLDLNPNTNSIALVGPLSLGRFVKASFFSEYTDSQVFLRKLATNRRDIAITHTKSADLNLSQSDFVEIRPFPNVQSFSRSFWRQSRPSHQLKGGLVLLPAFASMALDGTFVNLMPVILGTVAFNLLATSGYLVNDVIDGEGDSSLTAKAKYPYQRGELRESQIFAVAAILSLLAVVLGTFAAIDVIAVFGVYGLLSLGYSLWLKTIPFIENLVLVLFHLLRLVAGFLLATIPLNWPLIIFMAGIISYGTVLKRVADLKQKRASAIGSQVGLIRNELFQWRIGAVALTFSVCAFCLALFLRYLEGKEIVLVAVFGLGIFGIAIQAVFAVVRGSLTRDLIPWVIRTPTLWALIFLLLVLLIPEGVRTFSDLIHPFSSFLVSLRI